ncbi:MULTISPECIES: transcriptional regulator [unclassified Haloarcula]|uniref:RAD55 family ATPase n=1 Tax=unclassified Haloarcula TaxID=2624677 RepID=UPI000678C1C2|nr:MULTISPECIES: transcriptional regulator [unclassified Haloarcula]KAA9405306.1 transcriptional regulator [Haloarcula sp. CBA1131]KZX49922.1 transcriptional regulator [Haloarcula sp. K1]
MGKASVDAARGETVTQRFETGVRALDRKLDGGIPTGSLVTLLAEPASQAELFLSEFVARQETVYLSGEQAPTTVTSALRSQRGTYDDLAVSQLDREAPVSDVLAHVEGLTEESLLVVGPVEPLERADTGEFRAFLETLQARLAQTDSVAVLYALKHSATPPQRHRTEYTSDIVFDLETKRNDDAIENRLFVPKFRGGRALTEPIFLDLTDRINVDTSRDIA